MLGLEQLYNTLVKEVENLKYEIEYIKLKKRKVELRKELDKLTRDEWKYPSRKVE